MDIAYIDSGVLKKKILEIVGRHLDLKKYKLFFFGSRIHGNSMPRSDIDVGIWGAYEISVSAKLDIEEELGSLPMFYKIDFVDFQKVAPSFKEEAMKSIEMLN